MPLLHAPLPRRAFLARAAAAGLAAALTRRSLAAAAAPADPHTWALLSDTHIAADRARVARNINLADHLGAVVREVLSRPRRPAGLLINGDLALNTGEDGDYATLAELLLPVRGAGIPITLALGNHDHRARCWSGLPAERRPDAAAGERQAAVVRGERANWFVLDSLDRTNSTPGVLGAEQLAWLGRALDAHADRPALVMVHHNPNTGGNRNGLTDTDALMAVLRPRRHVKAHFYGHSHRWQIDRDESGLHLVNLPAVAYPFDAQQPSGWVEAVLQPGAIRLELRALAPAHPGHGKVTELTYRA